MALELLENATNLLSSLLANKSEDADARTVAEISSKVLLGLGNILRISSEDARNYRLGSAIGKHWYNVDKTKVLQNTQD